MWIGEKGPSERGRWEAKRSADRSIGLATSLSRLRRRSPSSLPLPPRASELRVPPPFPHLDPVKALENGYSCSRERARKRENRKSCETGGRKELKKKNQHRSTSERGRGNWRRKTFEGRTFDLDPFFLLLLLPLLLLSSSSFSSRFQYRGGQKDKAIFYNAKRIQRQRDKTTRLEPRKKGK